MFLFLQLEGQVSTTQGVVSQNNRGQDVLVIDLFLSLSLRVKRRLGKIGTNRIYVILPQGQRMLWSLVWAATVVFLHPSPHI